MRRARADLCRERQRALACDAAPGRARTLIVELVGRLLLVVELVLDFLGVCILGILERGRGGLW